jgi:hypothetical protein
VVTVALDRNADDPRPFIEAAAPQHPSLIDTEHRVADLYAMINVPTLVWIDERGRIVSPNEIAFGTDTFKELTGFDSGPYLDSLRAWVKENRAPLPPDAVKERQMTPTPEEQLAKAEFALGWYLHRRGRTEAAARHFERAGELSPDDFTVRRAAMPIQGIDPMTSPEFFDLYTKWTERGRPAYRPRPRRG